MFILVGLSDPSAQVRLKTSMSATEYEERGLLPDAFTKDRTASEYVSIVRGLKEGPRVSQRRLKHSRRFSSARSWA